MHGISSKKFAEVQGKEAAEQVYIDNEEEMILQLAESHYEKALSGKLQSKSVTKLLNSKKIRKPLIYQGFLNF